MLTVDTELLGIRAGESLLDIGCGGGRHTSQACREAGCVVCAVDIDIASVRKTKYLLNLMDRAGESRSRHLELMGDALRLPFRDRQFDRVICAEVLEHVPDDEQAVGELQRVLKDNGTLAVSVPSYLSEAVYWRLSPGYHHQPGGHVRRYRVRDLLSLLARHGLSVTATRRKHALHSFYWLLRCIYGIDRDRARVPALYHRFLVWDIMHGSPPVRLLESLLNPLLAKSVVIYARKGLRERGDA